jgi:hypothetical protein
MVSNADLRLFAPALGGARPAGLLGYLRALGLDIAWAGSPSYRELQPDSPILAQVQRDTERLADMSLDVRALSAKIAWASKDRVVYSGKYQCDRYGDIVPSTTHKTICKPRDQDDRRFLFVSGNPVA